MNHAHEKDEATPRPHIIVISADTDDEFRWMSDGWFTVGQRNNPESKRLMAVAHKETDAADDAPDAIKRLKAAGFDVTRQAS